MLLMLKEQEKLKKKLKRKEKLNKMPLL